MGFGRFWGLSLALNELEFPQLRVGYATKILEMPEDRALKADTTAST
jgi:hypothetical protein